jgi:predicted ester cyclase
LEELMSSDLIYHHHQMGEVDRETHLHGIALLNAAFSGIDIDHDQVAEDDLVSTRLIWRGVHTGEFQGLPATNREIAVQGISMERVMDDEVLERWYIQDELAMMQQLGVIPAQ